MTEPVPTPDEIASLLQVEHLLDQRWPESKLEPSTARISALMEMLGSPQLGYPSIHIAGTNGKTSVARMVDALMTAFSRRTGRTTSPHLQSAVERISIDGKPISPAQYVATYREIEPFVQLVDQQSELGGPRDEQVRSGHRHGVRRVRRRTGRCGRRRGRSGGRWDATNVVNAPVAVITAYRRGSRRITSATPSPRSPPRRRASSPNRMTTWCRSTVTVIARQLPEAIEVLLAQAVRADAAVAGEDSGFAVLGRQVAVGGELLELQGLGGVYSEVFLPLHGGFRRTTRGRRRPRSRRSSVRVQTGSSTSDGPGRIRCRHQPRPVRADAHRP